MGANNSPEPTVRYQTWQEASEAVQELVIESPVEYKERRKENSRLPMRPKIYYKDYPGDETFFGCEQDQELTPVKKTKKTKKA
ncbi:MAG: hypothetical protein WCK37_00475 [Candidatus Falkowbacteria bacterium]